MWSYICIGLFIGVCCGGAIAHIIWYKRVLALTEKIGALSAANQHNQISFKNVANEVLKAATEDLYHHAEKNLDVVLKPLKEKIGSFEKIVLDTYSTEGRERFALQGEIQRLIGLNEGMKQETTALTQALLGNSKTQGDWGELVLERILESSGLTNGSEYHAQKEHENEDGERMRPDYRIDLPEDKHLIIDSKVSLTAYEAYCRAQNDDMRKTALIAHLKSMQKHVDDLAAKHYSKLKGLRSPEFVFAFVPIEPAYVLAMQADADFALKAWRKGVAIVTSTTLLTSLKTVASIWRLEKQNRNALQIAEEAGKMYDKFCGFLEDFQKIGKIFEQGHLQYTSAMGKLKDGSGNIFRKMEEIRKLGAAPKNRIKQELIDTAEDT